MRIHTNTIELADVYRADVPARTQVNVTVHGSRTHARAFEVSLTGESRRNNQSNTGKAATWDQWGVFLSVLFDRDPEMVVGSVKRPVYADRYDFDRKTNGRFGPTDTNGVRYDMNPGTTAPVGRYWPTDAHGDHKFEFEGVRYDSAIVHRCTKCTAAQIRFA